MSFLDNLDDPKTMGLLNLAAGLMAAGGPSEKPVSLGAGLLGGLQQYSKTMAEAKKMKMAEDELDLRRRQAAAEEAYKQAQVADLRRKFMQQQQGAALLAQMVGGDAMSPSSALAAGAQGGSVGPTVGNAKMMEQRSPLPMAVRQAMLLDGALNNGQGAAKMFLDANEVVARKPGDVLFSKYGTDAGPQVLNTPAYMGQLKQQVDDEAQAKAKYEPYVANLSNGTSWLTNKLYAATGGGQPPAANPPVSQPTGDAMPFSVTTQEQANAALQQAMKIAQDPSAPPQQRIQASNAIPQLRTVLNDMQGKPPADQPSPGIRVISPSEQTAASEAMGGAAKLQTTAIDSSASAAKSAAKSMTTIGSMLPIVDQGKILAGPGSTFQQFGYQIGEQFGINGKNATEKLSNTATMINSMAKMSLNASDALKGQGSVTESERALLARAASVENLSKMTLPEIRAVMVAIAKSNADQINSHYQTLGSYKKDYPKVPTSSWDVGMPKVPVRYGTRADGARVIQYADGTMEYMK